MYMKQNVTCHKKENPTHIIDASVIEIIDKAGQQFQSNVKRDVTYQQTETDVEHTACSSLQEKK